jgi:septal ring-binding cell division protein DamX
MADPTEGAGDTGFDLDASMNEIASTIVEREKPAVQEPAATATEATTPATPDKQAATAAAATPQTAATATDPAVTEPVAKAPPKSWSKDKHELWSKLPPDAQDYYEQREKQFLDGLEQYKGDATYGRSLREIAPLRAAPEAQGLDENKAIGVTAQCALPADLRHPGTARRCLPQDRADLGLGAREEGALDPRIALESANKFGGQSPHRREQADQAAIRSGSIQT